MKVSKVVQAGESHVVGATGSTGAVYEAVSDAGVVVARFRPEGVRGYGRRSSWVRDGGSGRALEGRSCFRLKQFRAWAAEDFGGAFVRPRSRVQSLDA